jgi:16S rRNA (uracil1498-N3)-methyltransferase
LGKKDGFAVAEEQIREQPAQSAAIHLFFAPIKKSRMDWLVEKAIELGATDLHPVVTQNTEVRDVNADRLRQQMMEAAEQCERLDTPQLHPLVKLQDITVPAGAVFLAALERGTTKPLLDAIDTSASVALLIGPEGGFTSAESEWIQNRKDWIPVSLGPRILRCETAVCAGLSAFMLRERPR